MWEKSGKSGLSIVVSGLLALAMAIAAVLLNRWINRVSDADRVLQKEVLEIAFRGFQSEFASTIQEIPSSFRPVAGFQDADEIESHLAEMYTQWQSNARQPQLIGSVNVGTIDSKSNLVFRRYLPQEKKFETRDWPTELQNYREFLVHRWPQLMAPSPFPGGIALAASSDRIVVAIPATFFRPRAPDQESRWRQSSVRTRRSLEGGPPRNPWTDREVTARASGSPMTAAVSKENTRAVMGWYFIEIDPEFLKTHVFPNLIERHFQGAILSQYRLAVLAGDPRRLIYASAPALTLKYFNYADMASPLFRPQGRFGLGFRLRSGLIPPPEPGSRDFAPEPRQLFNHPGEEGGTNPAVISWQLVARHQLGSMDVEINQARRRNLAIGFGILLLMSGSIVTLMLSVQRARGLARQQMEFVAGVSHELRTPLSVIQSAGFNLARGVAIQTEKVQQYGTVIQTESRRLSDMVEQILSYAGIQSDRERYQFQPVEIGPLLRNLLADYRKNFEDAGWTVEQHIEEGLPPVLADVRALQSAARNLLENALKYATAGKWLRVAATASAERDEVIVTIEDHGPGIDPSDRPHIFKPFYRGRKVLGSSIPGAGLGLSLLERYLKAHGGHVKLANLAPRGASFALHLPVVQS